MKASRPTEETPDHNHSGLAGARTRQHGLMGDGGCEALIGPMELGCFVAVSHSIRARSRTTI
eukprot:scaffold150429_cov30-Tisochrysis_lutea.AAC.1